MRILALLPMLLLCGCTTYEWVHENGSLPNFEADRNKCAGLAEDTDKFWNGSFMDSRVFHKCMNDKGHVYAVSQSPSVPSEQYMQGVFNNMTIMNSMGAAGF